MHGDTAFAADLAGAVAAHIDQHAPEADVAIFPPFTLLGISSELLKNNNLSLGGQDCHMAESGAHTGDISAAMLADMGCQYVIVGHSERRVNHGETSEIVQQKAHIALESGLTPIICVGESLAQRESGKAIEIVLGQVKASMPTENKENKEIMLAYEPVWAIGSGRVAENEDILAMHTAIAGEVGNEFRILYGGSVKPANAAQILSLEHVGGVLVGGASLKANDFCAIIDAV